MTSLKKTLAIPSPIYVLAACCLSTPILAQDITDCFATKVLTAETNKTALEIREECTEETSKAQVMNQRVLRDCLELRSESAPDNATAEQIITQCNVLMGKSRHLSARLLNIRGNEADPYVISPLRQNYILAYTNTNHVNQEPYNFFGNEDLMSDEEVKMQISFKVPLTNKDLFKTGDGLYFGFTLKAFWQIYNSDISSPFRETNYRPEFYYEFPIDVSDNQGVWLGRFGIEHESNGQSQILSRSWNRVYLALGYMGDNWAVSIQPWYRLPEDAKEDDGDPNTPPSPQGDDNPDIGHYMGYQEINGAYRWKDFELSALMRYNMNTGKGALETGISFPLWHRLRGFVQYFDGYGESMIDYNFHNRRIGIGILLTDNL